MKRRLIALLLAISVLGMCALFTSCNQETVYGAVSKALESTRKMDSMAANMVMEMEMSVMGQDMTVTLDADIKAKELASDSPVAYTKMAVTLYGQTQEAEAYQEGDWMYVSADGMQYKTNVKEDMEEFSYTDDVNDMLKDIPEELVKDLEFVIEKDGSKTVTIEIPDDMFAEIYDDYLDSVNSSAGMEDADVTISDAVVVITVLNGYISVYEIEFAMSMEMSGVTVDAEVKASIDFESPDTKVEITPPEGYQNFEELN